VTDFTKDDLQAIFDKYFGGKAFNFDADNLKEFEKTLKQSVETLKKSQSGLTTFSNSIRGIAKPFNDFESQFESLAKTSKNLEEKLDELAEQAEEAARNGDLEKKAKLDTRMAELQGNQVKLQSTTVTMKNIAISKALNSAFSQLTVAGIDYLNAMIENSIRFADGLQAGTAGTKLYADAAIGVTKANANLLGTLETISAGAAGVAAALSILFPPIGLVAAGLTALAAILHLSKAAEEKYAEGQRLLSQELELTKKAFAEINSTGSVLGRGMTELREQASEAGLLTNQWSAVIKASSKDIMDMGGGMADAQRRLAKVSGALRSSGLDEQLLKLGYSFEEQTELAAQISASMVAAGDKRKDNELEVAQITANYAKDLKTLALITGEDAKKAMEKAKLQAMEADLLSKARRTGGPEAVIKMQRALAEADALGIKKGFMEYVSTGGRAVMDASTNIAMVQNKEIGAFMKGSYEDITNARVSAHEAADRSSERSSKVAQSALKAAEQGQLDAIGTASRAKSATGELTGTMEILNKQTALGIRLEEDAVKNTKSNADAAAANQEKLDKNNADIEKRAQLERIKQQDQFTGMLGTYTEKLKNSGEYLDTFKDAVMKATNFLNRMSGGTSGGGARPITTTAPETTGGGATVGGAHVGRRVTATTSGGTISAKDLRIKSSEATAGGSASDKLMALAVSIQEKLGGDLKYFSAFNDAYHQGLDRNSAHKSGNALDFTLTDPGKASQVAAMIRSLPGVKTVLNEYANLSAGGTGGHIHTEVQAANGGSFSGPETGYPATLHGNEAVVPLPDGKNIPVRLDMREMLTKMDDLIKVMKDHKDISEKTLWAQS
jgi:hypothetical protein